MHVSGLFCVFLALEGVTALYENCDYYQELQTGKSYYVYNPGSPQNYKAGASCRWYAVSPAGTKVLLKCHSMNIPPTANCDYDRLQISPTGDLNFYDGDKKCGYGTFSAVSDGNRMNIALITSIYSPGGNFNCTIGVQPAVQPPQPTCDCGWQFKNRIVGGVETGVNEYPMMAGMVDVEIYQIFCGATIISQRYLVTAAHCLPGRTTAKTLILVGDHDVSIGSETNSEKLYFIQKFIRHERYHSVTQANDIALIMVTQDIVFSLQVGPACLPFTSAQDTFTGRTVTALGWGALSFGGMTSNSLQKVDLGVTSLDFCQQRHNTTTISNDQICTYRQNKDACQSDSGGPLVWADPAVNRIKLVGIISYGIKCATETPGVNTRVTQYLSWIQQNTGQQYCVK